MLFYLIVTIECISPETHDGATRRELGEEYMRFCRDVWREVYPNERLGITAEMVEREFEEDGLRQYFFDMFSENRVAWISRGPDGGIQGGVSAQRIGDTWKMQGLYVAIRGDGLGSTLFRNVVDKAAGLPLFFEVPMYFDALYFYAQRGCEPTGELVQYPWVTPQIKLWARGIEMMHWPNPPLSNRRE